MGLINLLGSMAVGAGTCVALVTALPIAGAVGTITATGAAASSVAGAVAGAVDHCSD